MDIASSNVPVCTWEESDIEVPKLDACVIVEAERITLCGKLELCWHATASAMLQNVVHHRGPSMANFLTLRI
jgi:hypothetical protein